MKRRRARGGATQKAPPHGAHHMLLIIGVAPKKKPRRAGGHVEGAAARHHLGKRARGGPMDAAERAKDPNGVDHVPHGESTGEREVPMELRRGGRASGGDTDCDDRDERARGGKLTAAKRQALPKADFALPGKGEGPKGAGSGSYPIPDASHARNALARVSQHGTPEEKATVRRKVHAKYPGIGE